MKKLIIFLAFLILISFTYSFKPVFNNSILLNNLAFSDINYSIYCLNYYNNNFSNAIVINNGNGYIVNCSMLNAKSVKQNASNILGESICFSAPISYVNEIVKLYGVKILIEENVNGIISLYGYSNNSIFEQNLLIEGNIINIQIAFKNNILTIGTPIILGEY